MTVAPSVQCSWLGIFRLTVRKSVLGLDKDHGCGQHIRCKLCVMTCAGMDILMRDAAFLCGCLHIAHQLFVPVNGIPVPRLFHLAGAAVPFLVSTALDDRQTCSSTLGSSCLASKEKSTKSGTQVCTQGWQTISPVVYTRSL